MSACIYGVWVSDRSSLWEHRHPKFYVHGRLKEGDVVRRTRLPSVAMRERDEKETGKVTKVSCSTSKAGSLCKVEVEWSSGTSYKESFQWDDVNGYSLELAL